MKVLLIIILIGMFILVAIIIGAFLRLLISDLFESIIDKSYAPFPRLKFSQFKKFYDVNPDRWALYDNYVGCIQQYSRNEYFSFSFCDLYFRYKPFLKQVNKNKENNKNSESYLKMIAAVKQDIADFEQRSAAEVNSKINEIWRKQK